MGDTGVINARTLVNKDTDNLINNNISAYKNYLMERDPTLEGLQINISRFSDLTGGYFGLAGPLSDLVEDGKKLHNKSISLEVNQEVLRKVTDEQLESTKKGVSIYESSGFMLNYGVAGMILRNLGTDILIGTDASGSYMNYLYHSFIKPEELFVVVPK